MDNRAELFSAYADFTRKKITFGWGLNENTNPDIEEASYGYNFDLAINQSSLIPRKPFDLVGTATNASSVTSFMQLIKRDNTETTLVCAGTAVYLWDGASTFTSKATVTSPALLRDVAWTLGDYIVITDINKNNVIKTWDGTTFANLTTTGHAAALYAKYAIVHLGRLWLFNITSGTTEYPHMILVSKFEDPTNWDITIRGGASTLGGGSFATGLEAFYLLAPDLKPINGVKLFKNTLLISTEKGKLHALSGTNAKDFAFSDFYDGEPAVGTQSIESIGNDVVFIGKGGGISLLSAVQSFGNVHAFSLSKWIPSTTSNMATINQIVYDQLHQRVLFFINGKVLVLYKDLLAQDGLDKASKSPWSIYITADSSSFNTLSAKYMLRPGTAEYSVFFGDSSGRCFDLYGSGSSGDAAISPIQCIRRTKHIDTETIPQWVWDTENITGKILYHRQVAVDVGISLEWDDEYNTATNVVSLKGPPAGDPSPYFGGGVYFGGAYYFNAGFLFANRVSSISLSPGGKGPGFYLTLSATSAKPFQIDAIEFD